MNDVLGFLYDLFIKGLFYLVVNFGCLVLFNYFMGENLFDSEFLVVNYLLNVIYLI